MADPIDDAIRIKTKKYTKYDDAPDEYAVEFDDRLPGGCYVQGLYTKHREPPGEWMPNPCLRSLVRHLIEENERIRRAMKWNLAYDVLVTLAGAYPGDRLSFLTMIDFTDEYRFQGKLGFGGKFRPKRMSVDCYREDETPERLEMIRRTNRALKDLENLIEEIPDDSPRITINSFQDFVRELGGEG